MHPCSIGGTELGREAPVELFQKMGFPDEQGNMRPEVLAALKTIPQGAATTVWAATSHQLDDIGGVYCEDGNIASIDVIPHQRGVQPYSLDEHSAKRLWVLAEQLTGLQFVVE
ncbi:hypothetical protein MKQ70_19620 [Chitinophaga sedimenti]|uniref:hypothetical protein n=1 Tax=Chitinophaga sedimenti TaxID=2033606 RepID=UPI002005D628|nr:hypothetical protein [Chitinophaga sedimenti]MCK7557092.1 hypothetical protein [Chitinophaga sedimenti]